MRALPKLASPAAKLFRVASRPAFSTSQCGPLLTTHGLLQPNWLRLLRLQHLPVPSCLATPSNFRSISHEAPHDLDTSPGDRVHRPPDPSFTFTEGGFHCAYFDSAGKLVSKSKYLTKNEIAKQFDLRYRDLRDIDVKSEAVTRIIVRPATILVQFFDICMIAQSDEALLVDLQQSQEDDTGCPALYRDFERGLSGVKEAASVPELPYELRALEAALVATLSTLRQALDVAREEAERNAKHLTLESSIIAVGLDLLFEDARRLRDIEQRARSVRNTVRETLDADEDLAAMYLSDRQAGRPHQISDHQEAEYMLEAYHKAADGLVESAQAAINFIHRTEAKFRSSLAVQRNQIMFLEARIAVHTLGLAAGTLIAGLFGMNLVNYFENAPYGFAAVTGVCIAFSCVFSMYGMRSVRLIQTLREIQYPRPGWHRSKRGA